LKKRTKKLLLFAASAFDAELACQIERFGWVRWWAEAHPTTLWRWPAAERLQKKQKSFASFLQKRSAFLLSLPMRELIFISHRMPWPLNKGEKIRAWNLIQYLRPKFRIHLGCVVDDPADMAHVARLESVCASVGAFPINRTVQKVKALSRLRPGRPLMPDFYASKALQGWVDATLTRTRMDVIYIYSVAMAPYVLELAHPCKILDAQDVDSEKWAAYGRSAALPMRLVWAREARTLLAYERRAAAACEWSFFVSEPEAECFKRLAPESAHKIVAVECGVDLARFSPELTFDSPFRNLGSCLVLTGNMDYWPNADAAIWFAQEVMPVLRRARPAVQFWIVGANPGDEVLGLAVLPGVHVTGRVEDVRPYVAHAAVVVCPLRIARGIQNKVLEGMAMGKPVVASPAAFEGVRAEAGRELLVADGVAEFAARIGEVLDGAHAGLGAAARAVMERGYAWSAVLGRLDRYLG
jgi:sugar transferase (PEP-CTERM/EpsH1 system associated)